MYLKDIQVVFVCPDSNEKYTRRKMHTISLLMILGFTNVSMYKSSTENYPLCLRNAFVEILTKHLDDSPVLILEDDVDITEWYHDQIEFPEETDAFYLGFSKSGGSKTENKDEGDSKIERLNSTYIKILNMLSGHAILYISKRYKQAVIDVLNSVDVPYHTDVLISRIQEKYNIYGYYYPFFYQSSKLDNTLHVELATNFKFQKRRLVVTAYYPLNKCKHSQKNYLEWASFFFQSVTCRVICFCDPTIESTFRTMVGNNVTLVARPFDSFEMMSQPYMNIWNEFYKIDPEKSYHSPELYAIWAAKQEFVREAMKLVDSNIYIWCDIGCFRTPRDGSFKSVDNFVTKNKITCLFVTNKFDPNTIGGGVFAGDKSAWNWFSQEYIKELNKNPHGKDQEIYKRILNSKNANIILATEEFGDRWFHLTSLFSR